MTTGPFIIRTRHPIHDAQNLCKFGKDLVDAGREAYDRYDTLEEAQETGGYL